MNAPEKETKDMRFSKTDCFCAHAQNAAERLGLALYGLTLGFTEGFPSIALLCIGTDKATGDCLGPLTGSLLKDRLPSLKNADQRINLYGTLDSPVHAQNLNKILQNINKAPRPLTIAIDACLGKASRVGSLSVGRGSINPGEALRGRGTDITHEAAAAFPGQNMPVVGDLYITGVVNIYGVSNLQTLQSTRLNLVMDMARIAADGIYSALEMLLGKR